MIEDSLQEQLDEQYDMGWDAGWSTGERTGYGRGESERIALATANSELRSEILQLQNRLAEMGWGP